MGAFAPAAVSTRALISSLGRSVTLRRDTGTAPRAAGAPWEGVTTRNTDTAIKAAFDAYRTGERAGTEIQAQDVKAYVASLELGSVVPEPGDVIIDGTQHMRVISTKQFRPGDDSVAFELQLRPS